MMARDYKSYTDLVAFKSNPKTEKNHVGEGVPLFVPDKVYSFDSLASNSMKSMNPNSGCREVDLAKTLDTTIPCPRKNQGGLGVVDKAFGIPGNWIGRKPENGGNATKFMHEVAPAQTATDRHGVVAFNSRQDSVSGDACGALDTGSPQTQAVVTCATKQQAMTTEENMASTLAANDYKEPQAVAVAIQGTVISRKPENGPQGPGYDDSGVCFTQTAVDRHAVATATAVRRLTPVECERLMGFPDGYTAIPWRGKSAEDCPDGHRYKALGNSWAVPNVRWIGARIAAELNR